MSEDPVAVTEVIEEDGRFVVYMEVIFVDRSVRHRLQAYHSRSRAEMAADIMRRTANRDHRPDWGMS